MLPSNLYSQKSLTLSAHGSTQAISSSVPLRAVTQVMVLLPAKHPISIILVGRYAQAMSAIARSSSGVIHPGMSVLMRGSILSSESGFLRTLPGRLQRVLPDLLVDGLGEARDRHEQY